MTVQETVDGLYHLGLREGSLRDAPGQQWQFTVFQVVQEFVREANVEVLCHAPVLCKVMWMSISN